MINLNKITSGAGSLIKQSGAQVGNKVNKFKGNMKAVFKQGLFVPKTPKIVMLRKGTSKMTTPGKGSIKGKSNYK